MFDAIVLAGAASRRLGGADKATVEIAGRTLLETALTAAHGAERIIVAGPRRNVPGDVVWVEEDPPGGGPVAAIAAALAQVREQWCLVLASDLPAVVGAVPRLLMAASDAEVAVLMAGGRRNYLAAAWQSAALRGAVDRLDRVDGAAARELFAGVEVRDVIDEEDWGRDLDTWDDIERARRS
jgi:molybdopterin-guanine dinucleotide biosynthesis protein A